MTVVNIGSDLERKEWVKNGLVQNASKSFWSKFAGTSKDSIVYQSNNASAASGHTVVFDFDGNATAKAAQGDTTISGKGQQKRKFSDKLVVDEFRFVIDNGTKFDGKAIGDLQTAEHSHSLGLLSDLFTRWKDQSLFDAAQGTIKPVDESAVQSPTHVIDLGTAFTYNSILDIIKTLKTSTGFTTGSIRAPLQHYKIDNDKPCWLFLMDAAMANILRKDTAGYQNLVSSAAIRGDKNPILDMVFGKMGNLILMEADNFFGNTNGSTVGFGLDDSEIEISGLRQYAGTNPLTAAWTGQTGFDYSSTELHSRGLLLGASALQLGMGKMPDYAYESTDHGRKSESSLSVYANARKTKLKQEAGNAYKAAKIVNVDYGVVAVDLKVAA